MAAVFCKRLSVALLVILIAQVNAYCYYPDGSTASRDTPCMDGPGDSLCCADGYACLSSHICAATSKVNRSQGQGDYARRSCTDKTWRSSSCPTFCGTEGIDTRNDGPVNTITTISVPQSTKSSAASTTSSDTSSSSTSPAAGKSSSISTTSTSSPSSSSPSTETTPPSNDKKSSNGVVIGGIAGGSLGGAAALGGLAFFFLQRRRGSKNADIQEMNHSSLNPVEMKASPSPFVAPAPVEGMHEALGRVFYEAPGSAPGNFRELPA